MISYYSNTIVNYLFLWKLFVQTNPIFFFHQYTDRYWLVVYNCGSLTIHTNLHLMKGLLCGFRFYLFCKQILLACCFSLKFIHTGKMLFVIFVKNKKNAENDSFIFQNICLKYPCFTQSIENQLMYIVHMIFIQKWYEISLT